MERKILTSNDSSASANCSCDNTEEDFSNQVFPFLAQSPKRCETLCIFSKKNVLPQNIQRVRRLRLWQLWRTFPVKILKK